MGDPVSICPRWPSRGMGRSSLVTTMNENYLELVRRELKRLKKLAEDAMAQVSTEGFFGVPREGDNSIAVIVKHVAGNMLSRWTDFLTSDGEKPGRDRDSEFVVQPGDTRERLMKMWESGWLALFGALDPLEVSDLDRTVTIRGESLTVLQALNRQLSHYAYHVGQIVYVAKHYRGTEWTSLSIPLGASKQFNAAPAKYVSDPRSQK